MAWALVNSTTETTDTFTDGQVTVTVPETTVGNLLIVVVHMGTVIRTITSISGGATFTSFHRQSGASGEAGWIEVQAGIVETPVTSVTVTLSGNSTFGNNNRVTVLEFSGSADPATESGTSTGTSNATGVTAHDAAAVTPDTDETLFIGAIRIGGEPGAWTFDSDFTEAFTLGTTQTPVLYRIQSGDSSAQAFNNTSTFTRSSQVLLVAFRGATAGATTVTPAPATLTVGGQAPGTSAFESVRIREVLVNGSGQAVGNASDITLLVWYSGRFEGAPDLSLTGLTTDPNGTTSWSIATGPLNSGNPIAWVAQNSVSLSHYTAARMIPSYE